MTGLELHIYTICSKMLSRTQQGSLSFPDAWNKKRLQLRKYVSVHVRERNIGREGESAGP